MSNWKQNLKQWGLAGLLLVLVAVLETKAATGAFKSVADQIAAAQYAALSIVCAVLAFVFSAVAGASKHDVREAVRKRASLARLVSVACLLIPIGTLASSLKHDRMMTEWPAYRASPAYLADVATATNPDVDLLDNMALALREAAQRRIQEPTFVSANLGDFEWYYALFLQLIVIVGAGIRLAPPATQEEIKHERAVQAARKGVATRKRNQQIKARRQQIKAVK